MKTLSAPEKVLTAFCDYVGEERRYTITLEELIVVSWKKYPTSFGLKGYSQYPDSNKVITTLSGRRGLVGRGLLARPRQNIYTITNKGIELTAKLTPPALTTSLKQPPIRLLSADQQEILLRTLDSQALDKVRQGRTADVLFSEACDFWEIDGCADDQLTSTRNRLTEVHALLSGAGGELITKSGRVVTTADAEFAIGIHDLLVQKFTKHLNLIRARDRKEK